jgi:hypothetical protein
LSFSASSTIFCIMTGPWESRSLNHSAACSLAGAAFFPLSLFPKSPGVRSESPHHSKLPSQRYEIAWASRSAHLRKIRGQTL